MSNTKRLQSLSERLINRELRCETFTRAALLELIDILLDMQGLPDPIEDMRAMLVNAKPPRNLLDEGLGWPAKAPEAEPDTVTEMPPDALALDLETGKVDTVANHLEATRPVLLGRNSPPLPPSGPVVCAIVKPKRKPAKPRKRKAKK